MDRKIMPKVEIIFWKPNDITEATGCYEFEFLAPDESHPNSSDHNALQTMKKLIRATPPGSRFDVYIDEGPAEGRYSAQKKGIIQLLEQLRCAVLEDCPIF